MCKALAMEREEGRVEGRVEGRIEGRKEMAKETAFAMFAIGSPYEAVQAFFHEVLSEEEIRQIQRTSTEH